MKIKKGCINEACVSCQKKVMYEEQTKVCPVCDSKLSYVCRKCFTVLPDKSDDLCILHRQEQEDNKEKIKKFANIAGIAVLGATQIVGIKVANKIKNKKK